MRSRCTWLCEAWRSSSSGVHRGTPASVLSRQLVSSPQRRLQVRFTGGFISVAELKRLIAAKAGFGEGACPRPPCCSACPCRGGTCVGSSTRPVALWRSPWTSQALLSSTAGAARTLELVCCSPSHPWPGLLALARLVANVGTALCTVPLPLPTAPFNATTPADAAGELDLTDPVSGRELRDDAEQLARNALVVVKRVAYKPNQLGAKAEPDSEAVKARRRLRPPPRMLWLVNVGSLACCLWTWLMTRCLDVNVTAPPCRRLRRSMTPLKSPPRPPLTRRRLSGLACSPRLRPPPQKTLPSLTSCSERRGAAMQCPCSLARCQPSQPVLVGCKNSLATTVACLGA